MIRFPAVLLAAVTLSACSTTEEMPRQISLPRANVVPLALNDDFRITKVNKFLNDARYLKPTEEQMLVFERERANYGAITQLDYTERAGLHMNVWWVAKRRADLTLRLEYRQEKLGSYVQAKELHYPGAQGTVQSQIRVIGSEYLDNGRVTAWRLLLIEDGKAVALHQSFLWN